MGKPDGSVVGNPEGKLLGIVKPDGTVKAGIVNAPPSGAGAKPPSGSRTTVGRGAVVPPSGGSAVFDAGGGSAVVVAVAGATELATGAVPASAVVLF